MTKSKNNKIGQHRDCKYQTVEADSENFTVLFVTTINMKDGTKIVIEPQDTPGFIEYGKEEWDDVVKDFIDFKLDPNIANLNIKKEVLSKGRAKLNVIDNERLI